MRDDVNKRVWKSYVWHGDQCFFISTIERTFNTYVGPTRGLETLVWKYDWDKNYRGEWIGQAGGLADHHKICRSLIDTGAMPEEKE